MSIIKEKKSKFSIQSEEREAPVAEEEEECTKAPEALNRESE